MPDWSLGLEQGRSIMDLSSSVRVLRQKAVSVSELKVGESVQEIKGDNSHENLPARPEAPRSGTET